MLKITVLGLISAILTGGLLGFKFGVLKYRGGNI